MATKDTTDNANKARKAALKLLADGLVVPSEAARLAGVSRQLMNKWSRGINWQSARDRYLARLWRRAAKP